MQRAPQHRAVAEFGIRHHRRENDPRGADLTQQREGLPPLLLKDDGVGNLAARPLRWRQR